VAWIRFLALRRHEQLRIRLTVLCWLERLRIPLRGGRRSDPSSLLPGHDRLSDRDGQSEVNEERRVTMDPQSVEAAYYQGLMDAAGGADPYSDPYGGYADPYGAYADPYGSADAFGGYADPYGGYADPYGGYADPSGGYFDASGGYTDSTGAYADPDTVAAYMAG